MGWGSEDRRGAGLGDLESLKNGNRRGWKEAASSPRCSLAPTGTKREEAPKADLGFRSGREGKGFGLQDEGLGPGSPLPQEGPSHSLKGCRVPGMWALGRPLLRCQGQTHSGEGSPAAPTGSGSSISSEVSEF